MRLYRAGFAGGGAGLKQAPQFSPLMHRRRFAGGGSGDKLPTWAGLARGAEAPSGGRGCGRAIIRLCLAGPSARRMGRAAKPGGNPQNSVADRPGESCFFLGKTWACCRK